jgi:hypothetical protein
MNDGLSSSINKINLIDEIVIGWLEPLNKDMWFLHGLSLPDIL